MLVLLASEQKTDLVGSRLERAIWLLEKLRASEPSNESSRSPRDPRASDQARSSVSTPASDSTQPTRAHGQVVEGGSSLAAHSAFADEFVQKVAAADSLQDSSPELRDTIDELSSILTKEAVAEDELAYLHARPIQGANIPEYEMRPFKKAIALILAQHESSNMEVENDSRRIVPDGLNGGLRAMNPMMWMANSAEVEEWQGNNGFMTGLM
ncbi:fungal specific transcription factor factor domain protein [Fusarium tjaetaba]|uniref:Fungal specific transcription factor factor domain protein n=1 Tax=Fusarium tjaetaba TaxID=1567544 RepID=A0A8H5QID7_9HYPO|nr:fungal specific transcription factor factor domain protein [Fusarium tjaetaba]KAF5616466.1 fungal specific transcription factor factor domain protein [Fusarium tjaetaba]